MALNGTTYQENFPSRVLLINPNETTLLENPRAMENKKGALALNGLRLYNCLIQKQVWWLKKVKIINAAVNCARLNLLRGIQNSV